MVQLIVRGRIWVVAHSIDMGILFCFLCALVATLTGLALANNQLAAVGLAFLTLAAGAWLTRATGQAAIAQQFAREAHVQTKREVYAPLEVELRHLLSWLDGAMDGSNAFPECIDIGAVSAEELLGRPQGCAICQEWPTILAGHLIERFSPAARVELDAIVEAAARYNEVFEELRPKAVTALRELLTTAFSALASSAEHRAWLVATAPDGTINKATLDDWDRLHQMVAFSWNGETDKLAESEAELFVGRTALLNGRNVLGWMLAGDLMEAGDAVKWGGDITRPPVPKEWLAGQLQWMSGAMDATSEWHNVLRAARNLRESIFVAHSRLTVGIATIRNRYEGGKPIV
jgi:hypothetical protein